MTLLEHLVWTTAAGVTLRIADMGDRHLLNTILYLRRTAGDLKLDELRACMSAGTMLQGEMATYYNDHDQDRIMDTDDLEFLMEQEPRYAVMLREASRRDLDTAELVDEVDPYLDQADRVALGLATDEDDLPDCSSDLDREIPF